MLLPVAIAEGIAAPFLYDVVYGSHPFRADGMGRYIGYRPLALFENGNQYGIWICISALAATWLAFMQAGDTTPPRRTIGLWLIVTAMAVAAQSVGALLLLAASVVFLGIRDRAVVRPLAIGGAVAVALLAAVHLSGIVPLERIARSTPVGQQVLATMRGLGRGSFTWRLSQDAKVLPAIHAAPLAGSARWDWFRPFATRPWGLAMLIVGQFGLIGLLLAFGSVIVPAVAVLFRRVGYGAWAPDADAVPLAVIVLLAMADATLNSFVYLPAVMIAGGIAVRPRRADRHFPAVRPEQSRRALPGEAEV